MSIINNGLLLASGADAATTYQISRSLRFNSADSAYLSRTPGSAGNRKTWTWSAWVKRTVKNTATDQMLFTGGTTSSDTGFLALDFNSSDKLRLSSAATNFLITTAVYRDAGAWMHIVLAFDATQGTNANKAKLYVNGTEVTAFDTDGRSSIANQDYGINQAAAHEIGRATLGTNKYLDGYLADIYFLDGTATTPSTFAQTDAVTGQWVPKTPTGISYGTNGFRLSFSDNSGTTSTTLGKDAAGSNNWTPNNFSVASGSGNDSLVDTPTSYGTDTGAGGEVRGNYALANALDNGGQTLANGNLDITGISSNWRSTRGTIGMSSGKWYWEVTIGFTNGASNQSLLGIATGAASISGNYASAGAYGWEYYSSNGNKFNNGSNPSYGASYTNGDVIGVAFDADAGSLTFYKNGSSQGTAYTGLTSGPYFPSFSLYGVSLVSFNAGQRAFAYTAPSGFKALCDTNLGTPTIIKPSTVMDVKLYTGNGSSQTISGLGFSPDFLWTSVRDVTGYFKYLVDSVRGSDKYLVSFNTNAEGTDSQGITSLTSSGFTVGSSAQVNENGRSMVAWAWDAGTSTVTNNNGSISSQVRANASAGFSVVSAPISSSGGSIGHGLNVSPGLIIVKNRGTNGTNWVVWHSSLGTNDYLLLNSTSAKATSANLFNGVSSTTFTVGSGFAASTLDFICYCFAPVAGYSSFGSYTGNGSSQFVYLGFRPKFWMHKRTDATGSWMMVDAVRSSYNVAQDQLYANLSNADSQYGGSGILDFVSNGVVLRSTGADVNGSSVPYIYIAFAENPFAYARAR